jgi:hypothetical protein
MKSSLAFLVILILIAITISTDQNSDNTLNEDEYLLHAESSDRLLNIMQEISLIANSPHSEAETNFSEEDLLDLVEAVEELLFYAELMSIKVPSSELEESKSVIFSAMASKLYDETLNIQQLSKTYDLHVTDHSQNHLLNEAFNRLSHTCSACHQLFRDN